MSESRVLICKWGAAGDVLRTTPLLARLKSSAVDWLVSPRHAPLLEGSGVRILTRIEDLAPERSYDVVFSLEEDAEMVEALMSRARFGELIGTYISQSGRLTYTDSSRGWFDMSLISTLAPAAANRLKFENRRSYQELLFSMAGLNFEAEPYLAIPTDNVTTPFSVLLAPNSGARWPSKRWAFYKELASQLQSTFSVGWLEEEPTYASLANRVAQASVVIANDSLPLHISLSLSIPVCGLFTCTSPWEIFDYGLLTRMTSSRLRDFYYSNEFHPEAAQGIPVDDVIEVVARVFGNRDKEGSSLGAPSEL